MFLWEAGWMERQVAEGRVSGIRKETKRLPNSRGFFLVLFLKLKNVMSRNWFLIFILFQCNNVSEFKWSYSHFLVAVYRAKLDPPIAQENFVLFKCTGKSYGFPCGSYECVQPWNTSSCSTNLQQFSNVTCSKLEFFWQATVKHGRNVWPFQSFKSCSSKWIMTYLVCCIFLYLEDAFIAGEEKK